MIRLHVAAVLALVDAVPNVNVYDATTYASVMCDIVRTDANTVTLNFDASVGINALRASIVG